MPWQVGQGLLISAYGQLYPLLFPVYPPQQKWRQVLLDKLDTIIIIWVQRYEMAELYGIISADFYISY